MLKSYGKFARANMMSAMVSALPLLRFAEKQGWLGHRVFRGSGVETGERAILSCTVRGGGGVSLVFFCKRLPRELNVN